MRYSPAATRFFVIALLFAVVAAAMYGWLLFNVLKTEQSIVQLVTEIDTRTREEERLRSVEAILEATERERTALDSYFVSEGSVVPFIEELEALGTAAGVSVTITAVDTEPALVADAEEEIVIDAYQFLRVRLAARGAWADVFHFTTLLDAFPAATNVSEAVFARQTTDTGNEWRGSFTMRVGMLR